MVRAFLITVAMLPSLIARWCVGRLLIIAWPTRFVSFVLDFSDVVMLLGDLQMPLRVLRHIASVEPSFLIRPISQA